jgi:hypothetical protein
MRKEGDDIKRREEEVWEGEQGEKVILHPWKNEKQHLRKTEEEQQNEDDDPSLHCFSSSPVFIFL